MENEDIKSGDIVWLKSGGPSMTVYVNINGIVTCRWFYNDSLQEGKFNVIELTKKEPDYTPFVKMH